LADLGHPEWHQRRQRRERRELLDDLPVDQRRLYGRPERHDNRKHHVCFGRQRHQLHDVGWVHPVRRGWQVPEQRLLGKLAFASRWPRRSVRA
jgi:hypothetical protein